MQCCVLVMVVGITRAHRKRHKDLHDLVKLTALLKQQQKMIYHTI